MKYYIVGLLCVLAGYAAGMHLQPPKIETKEIQVVKEVETIRKDIRTVIKEVEHPDGTKEKETTIEDKSMVKKDSETVKVVSTSRLDWKLQGIINLKDIAVPIYGLDLERRIIGPFSAGAWATTQLDYGVSVSFEF